MEIEQRDVTKIVEHDRQLQLDDGVVLRADVFRPDVDGPVPALLHRTPYDKSGIGAHDLFDIDRAVRAGYGVVVQDVRGRYRSDGVFTPSADEAADGAATVAWVAAQPWCDGAVGMWGASYTAEVQWSALLGGAPALRAISPAVSPAHSTFDGFRFRGGAREFGSMIGWALAASDDVIARLDGEARRRAQRAHAEVAAAYADGSLFTLRSWSLICSGDPMVDWMLRQLAEPYDSDAHELHKMHGSYTSVNVPALLIAGWYDVFLGSSLSHYRALAARADAGSGPRPALVIGPWSHVNTSGIIGALDVREVGSFGHVGDEDITAVQLRWFDAALRGGPQAASDVFAFDTGTAAWHSFASFPPPARSESWHLAPGGTLTAGTPESGRVDFVGDPSDPVPTIGGNTLLDASHPAGPFDQSPLYARHDVISFRSSRLGEGVVVGGELAAEITFSTSGEDADIVVRLCDEHPDGTCLPVADGIVRIGAADIDPDTGGGALRRPRPGVADTYRIDLWAAVHTFRPGHRIRVDVTWSSSPRWDVNRHVIADPFTPVAPRPATHTIHLGGTRPSRIILPRIAGTQEEEAES